MEGLTIPCYILKCTCLKTQPCSCRALLQIHSLYYAGLSLFDMHSYVIYLAISSTIVIIVFAISLSPTDQAYTTEFIILSPLVTFTYLAYYMLKCLLKCALVER